MGIPQATMQSECRRKLKNWLERTTSLDAKAIETEIDRHENSRTQEWIACEIMEANR